MRVKRASVGTETKRDESCTERDGAGRFHQFTQNGAQLETYELFISRIFHLIFSGGKPRITETADTESADAGVMYVMIAYMGLGGQVQQSD
jgi:hypothetical protein